MESYRTGYSFKKLSVNQSGIALISAILIALFALLALAGLYFALTKLFGSSQTIKTYASIRDAAAGGVHYGIATKVVEMYSKALNGDVIAGVCDSIQLKFKLENTSGTFDNDIQVCYGGRGAFKTGFGKERVIGSGSGGGVFAYWLWFTIISEAKGPQDTHSRIEAVYAR